MTLKELSDNPELASEEDLKALTACFQVIKDMGKRFEPLLNGVTMDSGRSKEEIAYSYYVETMLIAAILESFITKSEQEFKEINKFVFNFTDKAFIWDVPITSYFRCVTKLCLVGLIELIIEDKYNPTFAITKDGKAALRQQSYANLAQSALFNLKTQQLNDEMLLLNKRAVAQNRLMLIVAIASAIVAFVSLFK